MKCECGAEFTKTVDFGILVYRHEGPCPLVIVEVARKIADALDQTARQGAELDEPEGARFITISCTAAREMAQQLRGAHRGISLERAKAEGEK